MSNKIGKTIDKKTLNVFVKLTKNKSKEKIKEKERKANKPLSKEEKKLIIRNVAKKTRGRAVIISMFALGAVSGMKTQNLLNSADEKGVRIEQTDEGREAIVDLENIDKVTIKGLNSVEDTENTGIFVEKGKDKFLQSLKVDVNEIDVNEKAESEAKIEVNSLSNSGEVLNYIKEVYIKEYNEKNGTNMTVDNLELYKDRLDTLYKDTAQNGDQIIRTTSDKTEVGNTLLDSDVGIVTATIRDKDGSCVSKEKMTYNNGKYVAVYDEDEDVKKYKGNTLTNLKGVVFNGIDYYGAFIDSESDIYKNRFIESVGEYKKQQIDNIVNKSQKINEDNEETR